MKLYYNPISTYAQKVQIALYEKDIVFEKELINLMDEEAKAKYLAIYPIGKVPLLVLDDGYKIPESTIIIEYLEGHFDQGSKLIPDGVDEARKVRFMDRMCDNYINNAGAAYIFKDMPIDASPFVLTEEKAVRFLSSTMNFIDNDLEGKTWLAGDSFTMADCSLIPVLLYLEKAYPFKDFNNLQAYWERAQERPSYQKVKEETLPAWEGMAAHLGIK